MKQDLINILIVEEALKDQEQFKDMVVSLELPYHCFFVGSVFEAKGVIKGERLDIIITDYILTDGTALDIIETAVYYPVIVVTGSGNIDTAINAIRAGASDYFVKDEHYNYLKLLPTSIERALKDKQQDKMLHLIEAAAENTNDTIIILESSPIALPGRKILYVNKAFCNMTGYTHEEVIGKTLNIFHGKNTDPTELEKAKTALETQTPITIEVANYKKDGTEFWVESRIEPFTRDGAWFVHWVSMDRDVTKKREYEDALKKAFDTAKEAGQLKSDFLSSVSHELRTPLTSILGFTVLLKENLNDYIFPNIMDSSGATTPISGATTPTTLTAKLIKKMKNVSEALDIMEHESIRLTTLINDVLDIAKIEAGKIEWKKEQVDMIKVFDKVLETALPIIQNKGLVLNKEFIGEDFIITADTERLIQAVSNIFNNAIKFTDDGSITYKIKKGADGIRCEITDTGLGIPATMLEHVFEKFKQIGDVLTDKPKGTGLGLPLCKVIIEHHGGKIWVESGIGKGSTFIFTLPSHIDTERIALMEAIKDSGRF